MEIPFLQINRRLLTYTIASHQKCFENMMHQSTIIRVQTYEFGYLPRLQTRRVLARFLFRLCDLIPFQNVNVLRSKTNKLEKKLNGLTLA